MRKIKVDRAIYIVDDASKTYRYFSSNPKWKNLSSVVNQRNKKSIDGYTRTLRNGTSRPFSLKKNVPEN